MMGWIIGLGIIYLVALIVIVDDIKQHSLHRKLQNNRREHARMVIQGTGRYLERILIAKWYTDTFSERNGF